MADEDAGRSRAREDPRDRGRRNRDDERGFSFSLPPMVLPEMKFPERIRLAFPIPDPPEKVSRPTKVRLSWVLLPVVLADALDAAVVLAASPETLAWTRAVVGLVAAVLLVGGPGLLYAWELLAVLGGLGGLSVAPTLTVLVVARALLSQ